jgi:osmotically-inducible protein OsmY
MVKSDSALRHDIEQEFDWDLPLTSKEVGVAVENGVVTLTGEVNSYGAKWSAERAVERVGGVRGVANELKVRAANEHNDTDITKAAANAVEWNASVPRDTVMVTVADGWVTLTGEVAQDYQRQAAERSVRYLRGVKGVTNLVTLKQQADASDVKQKIEESFARHASIDAEHIRVEANDGEVILRGQVRSWSERRDAERTARSGKGVKSVTNLLTVSGS